MDPKLAATYDKLKEFRTRQDLKLKSSSMPNLRSTFTMYGVEHKLNIRYYQVQGILHMYAMTRFFLGDDCGLGKTLQVICTLCLFWNKNPDYKVVVMAPKSAVLQWGSEFSKFTTGVNVIIGDVQTEEMKEIRKRETSLARKAKKEKKEFTRSVPKRSEMKGADMRKENYEVFKRTKGPTVLVVGYEMARIDFSIFQKWHGYIFVTDEATKFKTPRGALNNMVKHMSSKCLRMYALSATLIKNNLVEGFAIMDALVPGILGNITYFKREFCRTRMQKISGDRKIPVVTGHTKKHIAKFREVIDPYMLGRMKHEVASDLPPLEVKTVRVGLTSEQQRLYDQALEGLLHIDNPEAFKGQLNEDEKSELTVLTALTRCQQIVNHPSLIACRGGSEKLGMLMGMLEDEFASDKVIVFTRLKQMVFIIEEQLKKKSVKYTRITGDDSSTQREKAKKSFQDHDSGVDVILITMAATEAINLQSANVLIFYDLPYSAGDYIQIIGRMIRIGSIHDRCYAIHIQAEGTIDAKVQVILDTKMKLIEATLGKRIKGVDDNEDDIVFDARNDISDIFDEMLGEAARKSA